MSVDMHRKVEALAGDADIRKSQGDLEGARALYRQAAELEEQVLERIPKDRKITRSIIAVSAVSLYHKAGAEDDVVRLGKACMADKTLLPSYRGSIERMVYAWTEKRAELWDYCARQWRDGEWSKLGDDEMRDMVLAVDHRLKRFRIVREAIQANYDWHDRKAKARNGREAICYCPVCQLTDTLLRMIDGESHSVSWETVHLDGEDTAEDRAPGL